jgi:hypothetical protein
MEEVDNFASLSVTQGWGGGATAAEAGKQRGIKAPLSKQDQKTSLLGNLK